MSPCQHFIIISKLNKPKIQHSPYENYNVIPKNGQLNMFTFQAQCFIGIHVPLLGLPIQAWCFYTTPFLCYLPTLSSIFVVTHPPSLLTCFNFNLFASNFGKFFKYLLPLCLLHFHSFVRCLFWACSIVGISHPIPST